VNEGLRYAIYFVPDPASDLHRFGSSILGYDCYSGKATARPDELAKDISLWDRITAEPRRYGFHATLKAPFHLAPSHSEAQLVDAVRNFAKRGHAVAIVEPVIETLSGFVAIVPRQTEPALDALAATCTREFDAFRAPISPEERARRITPRLSPRQIENLDRWGYPFVFDDFRFHMTLTRRLEEEHRQEIVATLRRVFQRLCGDEPIRADRLAILKQRSRQLAFRVIGHAALRPG
jgi:putative phosphonate metabolism protein